jgi:hypothetical protein
MASIHADPRERNKRHYIAASSFNTVFYSYATSMNMQTFNTVGTLSALTSATTSNCPSGRILREVGVRLYPDAHPGISTMMVKVYDANSGLSGYIDPNAPQFAVFNSDKPIEIVDGNEVGTTTPHKGQPVFTTGDVIAGGEVVATGQVRSSTVTPLTPYISGTAAVTKTINPLLGEIFYIESTPGVAGLPLLIEISSRPAGARITLIISHQNTNTTTITFGTNMFSAGSYAPNTAAIYTISFVCDGNNWVETSRTGAQA